MRLPTLGIGQRILVLGAVTLGILTVLVWGAYLRGIEVLRGSAEEALRARAQALAAELDRASLEALTAARGLALAVADGGIRDEDRFRALTRGLLEERTKFLGAWIALESSGDGAIPSLVACTRDPIDPGSIDVLPSDPVTRRTGLLGRGYERVKAAASDGGSAKAGVVARVRRDDGRMVVSHMWPIMSGGRFLGAAGVSCSLAEWENGLSRVRDRLARTGWTATLSVLGAEGEVIATTSGDETAAGESSAWRNILERVRRESEGFGETRTRPDDDGLLAGAEIPTPGWTVVARLGWSAITSRVQRPMFDILLAACGALGLLMAALSWLATRVGRRVRSAAAAARRVAEGDLTAVVGPGGGDETGQLLSDVSHMTHSLRSIVEQVKDAGRELSATSRDLASAEAHQEEAIHSLGASTTEAAAASRQISVTGRELLATMNDVATVANETAAVAGAGRENLGEVGETMHHLEESAADVGERLGTIRQRAEDINMVITTITKVADQTNLLSINAAIEAEKAGAYGQGFIVVAREIRRLADQTAVATLDIERLVEQMQQAVGAGVTEMERFAAEVKHGVDRVAGISGQFADVIGKVQGLSTRFDQVNDGMRAQAAGAQQIAEALVTLTDGSRGAADALQEFQGASRQMARAVEGLNESVSRFRLGESGG